MKGALRAAAGVILCSVVAASPVSSLAFGGTADRDGDGIADGEDNCPDVENPGQVDGDSDGFGIECDCDDNDAGTFPGAVEICDRQDNDCDSCTDEGVHGCHGSGLAVDWILGLGGMSLPLLHQPVGIALDAARGRVVIGDNSNRRVRVFSDAGDFLFTIGTSASFSTIGDLAVGPSGRIHVVDRSAGRVQVFGSEGDYLFGFGTPGSADGQFFHPGGIDVDASGRIHVVDSGNHRVQVFDVTGTHLLTFGGEGSTAGLLDDPRGIDVDATGRTWLADSGNHRIQVFGAGGAHLFTVGEPGSGAGQFNLPGDVAAGSEGRIWVADSGNHRIQVLDPDTGLVVAFGGVAGSEPGQFSTPTSIAVDDDRFYVTDFRVQAFPLVSDADSDGFTIDHLCPGGPGSDCDGQDEAVYPGATEVCDGVNNDCDSPTWPTLPDHELVDLDGDGATCDDCDDTDPTVFPGAMQLCDGVNTDCDDPDLPDLPRAERDEDGDGFLLCAECNDLNAEVNPDATEVCNSIDDDCDNAIDEDALGADTDADGVANACDNCPSIANSSQSDVDEDGRGDLCDPDTDEDGIDDDSDNCVTVPNSDQDDRDDDGIGTACDNCPTRPNPEQGGPVFLSASTSLINSRPKISPDGTKLAFNRDDPPLRDLIFRIPVGGGAPTTGYRGSEFGWTPDSQDLVYTGWSTNAGLFRLLDGEEVPIQLVGPMIPGGRVHDFAISPDGNWVVYKADQERDGVDELFSIPINGGSPNRLSAPARPDGEIGSYRISPDSAWVVLKQDLGIDGRLKLFSVPIQGGPSVNLSTALGADERVHDVLITSDSQTVVFTVRKGFGSAFRLRSTPISGGVAETLEELVSGVNDHYLDDLLMSPDGSRVAYSLWRVEPPADMSYDGDFFGRVVSRALPAGPRVFHTPEVPTARLFSFTPDSGAVVFSHGGGLVAAPIDGGAVVSLATGSASLLGFAADLAVYTVPQGNLRRIRTVPLSGGEFREIGALAKSVRLTPAGDSVVYANSEFASPHGLFSVSPQGGDPRLLSEITSSDSNHLIYLEATPAPSALVYAIFDRQASFVYSLYSVPLDGDFDGSPDDCDLCVGLFDPEQTDADLDGVGGTCDNCPDLADSDQSDEDLDGAGAPCDCDEADASVFAGAAEINDGQDNQCPGDEGFGEIDEVSGSLQFNVSNTTLNWQAQPGATDYQLLRAGDPEFADICEVIVTTSPTFLDVSVPDSGEVIHYLVRVLTPNTGGLGKGAEGLEREPACTTGPQSVWHNARH